MRTLNELAEFDYIIKYRPGTENQAADFLSQLENNNNDGSPENTNYK